MKSLIMILVIFMGATALADTVTFKIGATGATSDEAYAAADALAAEINGLGKKYRHVRHIPELASRNDCYVNSSSDPLTRRADVIEGASSSASRDGETTWFVQVLVSCDNGAEQ